MLYRKKGCESLASALHPASDSNADNAAGEMSALVADFPEYDEELLKCMLEDQAGDVEEVRATLRVRFPLPF